MRTAWDDEREEWYFSIVDVCGVLTESKDPQAYWRKLKQRLKDEGNETVTNCHALKMQAADGKMRKRDPELDARWGTICTPVRMLAPDGKQRITLAATTEGIFRIIQSIPSPKAEPAFALSEKYIDCYYNLKNRNGSVL